MHSMNNVRLGVIGLPLEEEPELLAEATGLAVAHREFHELGVEGIRAWGKAEHVLYDLKYVLPKDAVDLRL